MIEDKFGKETEILISGGFLLLHSHREQMFHCRKLVNINKNRVNEIQQSVDEIYLSVDEI